MKIHICSDLHLEFSKLVPHSATQDADVIVLAGDIWLRDQAIPWARAAWPDKRVVYVPGNHEFYGAQRQDVLAMLRLSAQRHAVDFLDNDEVIIDGVRFLGCTLWTDFLLFGEDEKKNAMFDGQQALNDFRVIFEGEWHFSAQDSINLHQESVNWLEMKLKHEPFSGPTIVVTHHAPSWESVVPKYRHDLVSACFASRLDHLLGFSELWIHGHTHSSLDYMAGDTRVICNPRGYVRYEGGEENSDWNPSLLIDLDHKGFGDKLIEARRLIKAEFDYRLVDVEVHGDEIVAVLKCGSPGVGSGGLARLKRDLANLLGERIRFGTRVDGPDEN